jgi:hypothetical protein
MRVTKPKVNVFLLAIVLGFLLMFVPKPVLASSNWLDSSWNYRRTITIDHSKVGGGTEPESNFPVLVSLSGLSNINTNGTDIRFTSADGITQLPTEIESYSSGTLLAWVKVPSLSYTADTVIYMYYGNSSATEPATNSTYGSQNVWDSSFKGVWHLKETGTSSAGDYKDSTSNTNDSVNTSYQPTVTNSGKIGKAESFDGVTNFISVGNSSSLNPAQFTISFWVDTEVTSATGWNVFVAKEAWNTGSGWLIYREITSKDILIFTRGGNDTPPDTATSGSPGNGWHHIVGTYNGTNMEFWLDNTSIGQKTTTIGSASTIPLLFGSRHGNDGTGNGDYGNVILDEVKFSSAARSSGWIATEYTNQSSPSTFLSGGSEETYTPSILTSNTLSLTTSSSSAPSCNDIVPVGIPDLFEINANATSAKLNFTTSKNNVTGYLITYGFNPTEERYGTKINYSGPKWIIDTTVNELLPNTTYYFRVKPLNGCNAGEWSNSMMVKTGKSSGQTTFYKNLLSRVQSAASNVLGQSVSINPTQDNVSTINDCSYTVQGGDTLWNISRRKFGSGYQYHQIADLNPGLDSNFTLHPSQTLTLCKLDTKK